MPPPSGHDRASAAGPRLAAWPRGERRPDRLRVGLVTSWSREPSEGSGTARAVNALARGLEALGHEVRLLAPSSGGHLHIVPRLVFNLTLPLRHRRLEDLDLLVGVDLDGFILRPRVPYVVTLKGVAADEARWERGAGAAALRLAGRLEAANARRAHRVVVPSRYAARMAGRRYGLPEARIAVVPEAVMPPHRLLDGLEPRPARHERPTILSVARQYPRKRTDVLLRAVAPLLNRVPDVQVRIVGDGPELPRLRRLASSLGIGSRVTFLGRVSEIQLALEYARAHCFCLASEQEAFGIAVVEAMAAGLPVVATRAAALPEVVADGVDGVLVEPGRPDALAAALEAVLADPARAAGMGEAGRARTAGRTPVEHARGFLEAVTGVRRQGSYGGDATTIDPTLTEEGP